MAKQYQWSAAMTVESGGYEGEALSILQNGVTLFEGSISAAEVPKTFAVGWTTTSSMTGSETFTYTYRDSDVAQNSRSTMVAVTLTDSWSVSINSRNYMTVTVDTTLVSAVRTVIGSPSNVGRHLWLRRSADGVDFAPFPLVDNGSTAHTIATNIHLGSYTFTLAPGEDAQRATAYWRNTSVGYESLPIPNIYTDIMNMGVHFKNILPKDYRPGATLNTNTNTWVSHNRSDGACHVLPNTTGTNWHECRTIGGEDGAQGNPPLLLHSARPDAWFNQKLLGKGD